MGQSPSQTGFNIAECWPPPLHGCWSIPSVSKSNVFAICARSALQLEFDGGQTDEGDPWFLVYDRDREQVVLHIARIDRRYVMARASRPKPLTVSSLSAAVDAALDELYRAGRTAVQLKLNRQINTAKQQGGQPAGRPFLLPGGSSDAPLCRGSASAIERCVDCRDCLLRGVAHH